MSAQQLTRNTQLFQRNAVPQRVLEASQTEARQASIVVAERRQMLRLSGLSDDAISKLTNEAAITATLSVLAPRSATVVDIIGFSRPAGGANGLAHQARPAISAMGRNRHSGVEHPRHPARREGGS